MRTLFGVIALALLVVLSGCIGTSSRGNAFTVSGTVTDQISGQAPAGNTFVVLQQNGITVAPGGHPITRGQFTFPDIPNGSGYQLVVTNQDGITPPTIVGLFTVAGTVRYIPVQVLSTPELQQRFGIFPPANNTTATLAALAKDANGNPLSVTIAVDGGTPTAVGNPAVASNLTAGTHQITVTNIANGQAVAFRGIALTGGAITVIRTIFGPQQPITLAGFLRQDSTSPPVLFGNAPLILRQHGEQVATTTTEAASGAFSFPVMTAGANYTIEAVSPTNHFVRTIFGPSNFTADTNNLALDVFTLAQLQLEFSVLPPPNQSSVTLLALARTAAGTLIPLRVQLDTLPVAHAVGTPAIITNIPPGTYTVTITNAQNAMAVALPNVTLPSGSLTMIDVAGSQLGFTSGSLVSRGKRRR